ncbi:MAG TPA: M48 family metalloprotease [Urbifossiella sp.]|nr:M48 family metalloprotease [Urbifossiella sp.]
MTPRPLPYHRAIVEHLQSAEPGLWNWFASTHQRAREADSIRLDLLKSTYRLDPPSQPRIHELAEDIRERMHLSCSVTLYQSQSGSELNAALAYLPSEAHIVLSGPLASVLSEGELRAVLAHELAHFLLFSDGAGDYLTANDLLHSLAIDPASGHAASESVRLFNLWAEIYADRWACHLSNDPTVAIAALLKTSTGLTDVNAESYLRQAEEIFSRGTEKTENMSHPEPYIRARALQLWAENGDDAQAEIERMIEGGLNLQRLDLLGQKRAACLTRRFLQSLLVPAWFRTESVLAHARHFFADFAAAAEPLDAAILKTEIDSGHPSLHDYLGYLMLDFVTVDRDLGDPAIAAAIVLARGLGIDQRFAELMHKELGLGKKAYAKIDKDAESILARTESSHRP